MDNDTPSNVPQMTKLRTAMILGGPETVVEGVKYLGGREKVGLNLAPTPRCHFAGCRASLGCSSNVLLDQIGDSRISWDPSH